MRVIFRDRDQVLLLLKRRLPKGTHPVRVEKDGKEAKFRLSPQVSVAYNDGYNASTLRELLGIVEANTDRIERVWNDFSG